MIKWFEKIKDIDNILIKEILNSNQAKFYNSEHDVELSYEQNPNIIYINYPFKQKINIYNLIDKTNTYLILDINNDFILNIDKFAKKIIKFKKQCDKKQLSLKNIPIIYIISENLNTDEYTINNIFNLYHLLIALKKETKKEMYEYIYDICCDYLDYLFRKNNYCDFKNDKCIANREKTTCHLDNGCCYNVTFNRALTIKVNGVCPYQKNKTCQIKCLPCKLFTCKYYRKKGINFTPNNIFLLKHIFNAKQKLVLKYNIYTDKDLIIKKLLENNKMPYIIYYLTWSYYINLPK